MYSSNEERESFVASGDLSNCLNRVVDVLGDFVVGLATANTGIGVLTNKPKNGEFAAVATDGIVMVRVGAAVSANDYLTSAASGWAVKVTSGAGQNVFGRVRTGAASGMLAAVALDEFYRANSVGN